MYGVDLDPPIPLQSTFIEYLPPIPKLQQTSRAGVAYVIMASKDFAYPRGGPDREAPCLLWLAGYQTGNLVRAP